MTGTRGQRIAGPFDPRVVLVLLAFGALAFVATLYFIGAGETGGRGNDGRAHAAANGLNGYSGLAGLLEYDGFETQLSRSPAAYRGPGLLVLTPPAFAEAQKIETILAERRFAGPTLLILPKWQAAPIPSQAQTEEEVREGWVELAAPLVPRWNASLPLPDAVEATLRTTTGARPRWEGLDLSGGLPDGRYLTLAGQVGQLPLVVDQAGRSLVVQTQRTAAPDPVSGLAGFPVTIVGEPDLVNNYGLADAQRAALARAIVVRAMGGEMQPVVFDLTQHGFGGAQNLLTLAFRPPFLAATLCLLLAMLIVAWRGFLRFGPAVAEPAALDFGKRRLVANGAGLIVRARRYRLLAEPYVALIARRLAARLGLRLGDPALIDRALLRRAPDAEPFSARAEALRQARSPRSIIRAASALKDLERTIAP